MNNKPKGGIKEIYKRLFDSANAAILIIDSDFKFVDCNKMACTLLDRPKDEIIGKTPIDPSLSPEYQPNGMLTAEYGPINFSKAAAGEDPAFEWMHLKKDGTEFPVEVSLFGFMDSERTNFFAMWRDLTDAKESERLKTEFLESISHELRTPLNAIVGFSNLIAEVEELEQRKQYDEIIQTQSSLLTKLVEDIVDFSETEAGTIATKIEKTNICGLIFDSINKYQSKLKSGVKIISKLPKKNLWVYTDAKRVNQVLNNLISNAVKFTEKGTIEVGCSHDNDQMIQFYVKDTGIGINKQYHKKVFDKFFKMNMFSQGTGLGLAIAKNVVNKLGGEIRLESEEGEGLTVYFNIPCKLVED